MWKPPSSFAPESKLREVYSLLRFLACFAVLFAVGPEILASPSDARWLLDSGDWRFSHLGVDDGLVTRVLQITQNRDGFIWFGTQAGLMRYDGRRIRRMTHDPADLSSLSNNYVRALLVDQGGRLWVGVDSGDLNRWDPAAESFARYPSVDGESVVSLMDLSADQLLVSTGPSLFLYDISTEETIITVLKENVGTLSLARAVDGSVWVVDNQGLGRVVETEDVPSFEHLDSWPGGAVDDGSGQPADLFEDKTGVLWIVGSSGRISCFDPAVGRLETGRFSDIMPASALILSGLMDEEGRLWIGTIGGVYIIEPGTGRHHVVKADPWQHRGLANNLILDIFQDRTGQIWLATDSGAARFDPLREDFAFFAHHPVNPRGAQGPPPGSIGSFAVDADGGLWVGSLGSGLARMDPDGSVVYGPSSDEDGLSGYVRGLLVDSKNRLWAGHEDGLAMLDLANLRYSEAEIGGPEARWRRYGPSDPDDPDSRPESRVIALLEDDHGILWAGGDFGLAAYDPVRDRLSTLDLGVSDRVLALAEDHEGRLWLGFDGLGIAVLGTHDPAAERSLLQHYKPASRGGDGADLLSHGVVSGIAVEPKHVGGGVWASTLGGGLLYFGPDGARRTVRTADGLPGDSLKTLEIDAEGRIWTAVDAETLRFDPQTGEVRRFSIMDGVPKAVHSTASFQHEDQLFFGGIDGFTTFLPQRIALDREPPTVILTDFLIGDESVKPAAIEPSSPLSESITSVESVVLSHRLNEFTIEMAAVHFGEPSRNRFSYMLEGVDSDWIEVGSERGFARYTRIPAGWHTLRVRAANRDGVWSEEELRLKIRILPPPWRSWWALLLYGVAFAATVVWAVRRRLRSLREERDRQATELKVLRGLLPICASCKRIRDDGGEWENLEAYLDRHSEAKLSHGICPTCAADFFGV